MSKQIWIILFLVHNFIENLFIWYFSCVLSLFFIPRIFILFCRSLFILSCFFSLFFLIFMLPFEIFRFVRVNLLSLRPDHRLFVLCFVFLNSFASFSGYVRPFRVQSPPASAKTPKSISDRKRFFENAMEDHNKPAPKSGMFSLHLNFILFYFFFVFYNFSHWWRAGRHNVERGNSSNWQW